jgi:SPP1 gp7 family putative phage head morphogenesis protein
MTDKPLFTTAPREVIAYFDRRPSVPTFDWRDLAAHEHALAHTVAKTAGFDILDDLRQAIRKAVVDRTPFEQFRDDLIPILKRKGWWGDSMVTDPQTGARVKARLGSPRRLQIIYWANVHSAHAAGEWTRIERNKDFLPWLTYVSSASERKRPLHLSWVGTTLRVDDPWWRTHYPPNGWNCKCSVRQIGDREADRLHTRYGRDAAPAIDERPWLNRRTGATEMIPAGIDPGWQTNAGLTRDRALTNQLQGALDRMSVAARDNAVSILRCHPVMDYVLASKAPDRFSAVAGRLPEPVRQALGARSSIVRLSGFSARHVYKHPEMTAELVRQAARIIEEGEAFRDCRTVVFFGDMEGALYRVVVKRTEDGNENYIATMHRAEARNLKKARRKFQPVLREELVSGTETPGGA